MRKMMKVVLFALVCVASTQVFGNELEDQIKEAIKNLESTCNKTREFFTLCEQISKETEHLLSTRSSLYIQQMKRVENEAVTVITETAKNLTAKAKEGKLPQDVIKCITKEEQAALSSISSYASKFETQMKELLKQKLSDINQGAKEILKLRNAATEKYNQGVAELKKCKDKESIGKTFYKYYFEFDKLYSDGSKILDRTENLPLEQDREGKILTINTKGAINLAKNLGVKNMKECFPKTV